MKTTESKTNTYSAQQQKSTAVPFFPPEASREGFFGSETSQEPFFKPASPFGNTTKSIQPKLTIGQPGDKYEQEADAMADQVVQKMACGGMGSDIQRQCAECAQDDEREGIATKLQRKPIFESNEEQPVQQKIQRKCAACDAPHIQRMSGEEEEPELQAKSDTPGIQASSDLESRLNATKGDGSPLPAETQSSMDNAFGTDFSGVRVHTNSGAVQMNQELGAQAFTHGSDVYFNSEKYSPGSTDGDRLLAHELTHTVQQGGGSISPMVQRGILDDIGESLGDAFNTRDNEAELDLQEDIAEFKSQNYGPISYRRSEISGSGFEASYFPISKKLKVTVRAALRFADTVVAGSSGFSSPNHFFNIGGFMPIMNSLPASVQSQILPLLQWNNDEKQKALIRFRENLKTVMDVWQNANLAFQVNEAGWEGITAVPEININVREGDAVTNKGGVFNLFLDESTSDHLQIEMVKQPTAAEMQSVRAIINNHNAAIGGTVKNNMLKVRSYLGNDPDSSRSSQAGGAFNNFMSLESDRSDDPADKKFEHTTFFENDRSILSPEQAAQLDSFLSNPMVLLDNAGRNIKISLSGFASHTGSTEYNRNLVEDRMQTIRDTITAKQISSTLNTKIFTPNDTNDADLTAENESRINPDTYDQAKFRKVDIVIERKGRGGQNVLAHEFGHVFGLGDEYAEGSRTAHTAAKPSLATHSPLSEAAGAGQATVGTDSARMMDAGNRVDAPHYSTFADALSQLTNKSWKIITP